MASIRTLTRSRLVASKLHGVALVALMIGMAGCASKAATIGDEIDAAGEQYSSIAERWEEASDKVAKGRKLMSRGRDRVRDGEDDIERAERLVREGEREMARSEKDYEKLKARSGSDIGPALGQ